MKFRTSTRPTSSTVLRVVWHPLNDGTRVLATDDGHGGLRAVTYANRTQATKRELALRDEGWRAAVIRPRFSGPFYVEIFGPMMFSVDSTGDAVSFSELRDANRDDPELLDAIRRLEVGETFHGGGGAAEEFSIRRVL